MIWTILCIYGVRNERPVYIHKLRDAGWFKKKGFLLKIISDNHVGCQQNRRNSKNSGTGTRTYEGRITWCIIRGIKGLH